MVINYYIRRLIKTMPIKKKKVSKKKNYDVITGTYYTKFNLNDFIVSYLFIFNLRT